ncbi:hypothetical protein C7H19_20070 [Aphanothece hegewaldii CCALA 016]|uniref:Uncharacterized protein n=1 Tax=Aphanothece hegewaldii CCALA 016 TaxID=2107694 RepID=A0A2T1LT41_9CHRO|nr:hypothetical protein [Aphanothece hegewaldii]PSF33468.1 hypothetical protein C7H19_20070 [Aphanothece hegewaldii CCALA 016]
MNTLTLTFNEDFAKIANSLREAGAKFYTNSQGENRILQFSLISPKAEAILNSLAHLKIDRERLESMTVKEICHLAGTQGIDLSSLKKKRKDKLIDFILAHLC